MKPYALVLMSVIAICGGCEDGPDDDAVAARNDPVLGSPELDAVDAEAPDVAVNTLPAGAINTAGEIDADMFVDGVDHTYMPLPPGGEWTYEGDKEGQFRRDEITVLHETEIIFGVACTAQYQKVFLDGVLVEITTEWFAQDVFGNVWKFGEESLETEGGVFVVTEDTWQAGLDDAVPWKFLAAEPEVGDVYTDGMDERLVLSLAESVEVPAGSFEGCLSIIENQDDPGDKDIIIYSPNVGLVSETSVDGAIVLVSVRDG